MAALDKAFWTELDAQIAAANCLDDPKHVRPEVLKLAAVVDSKGMFADHATVSVRAQSDWTGVLDTIAIAKSTSEQQKAQLREQAAAHNALLLKFKQAEEQVRTLQDLLASAKAEAEIKAREATAETEAREQAIQARADAQVQAAHRLLKTAELRADAAEDWLTRVTQASLDLVPGVYSAAA